MTTSQRIGSSLLSILLAVPVASLCFSVARRGNMPDWLGSTVIVSVYSIPFCVLGWLLALPLILNRISKGRSLWTLLLIGSSIGPFVMYLIGFCFEVSAVIQGKSSPNWDPIVRSWLYLATGISCLTTLIFLSLVRYIERREQSGATDIS